MPKSRSQKVSPRKVSQPLGWVLGSSSTTPWVRANCSTTSMWPVVPRPQTRTAAWPGGHSLHSFSNGKRCEASAARLFRVILGYSGFCSSLASRFCGQEAARTLAVSACELVPSSSSEESPPPAFAWGAPASLWGKIVEEPELMTSGRGLTLKGSKVPRRQGFWVVLGGPRLPYWPSPGEELTQAGT